MVGGEEVMKDTAEIEFTVFEEDLNSLSKLPDDQLAALSILSFATSELNTLQKIYLSSAHDYIGIRAIDSASNMFKFLILRTWSAKIFEVWQFFCDVKKQRRVDNELRDIVVTALKDFENLKENEGYEVARALRNEASNHYSFDAARKNLKHIPENMDLNFYTHESGGNDMHPLGEAVMFHARLNRKWANIPQKELKNEKFHQWLKWCQAAVKWVAKWHAEAFATFCKSPSEAKFVNKRYTIPVDFIGNPVRQRMPLFIDPKQL